jgi:hypothetical protein
LVSIELFSILFFCFWLWALWSFFIWNKGSSVFWAVWSYEELVRQYFQHCRLISYLLLL